MSDAASPSAGFRLNGWHVLAGVVGFFAVVVAVDSYFVAMALKTFPGQVSDTPYEDGLAYNRKLAQLAAQAQLGWRAAAEVGADGSVIVEMRDASGAPVTGLSAMGRLERPATEAGRLTPAFVEGAPGDYVARPGRLSGAWDLTLELEGSGGRRFVAERRLTWP